MTKQPHGTTTTRDDNGATSQLLLPCQLTCALPLRGVDLSMTRGCTLHGFLTRETPCTPLPIPADYPDPCRGYGFLEGTGIGHREVTRGLPVPITTYILVKLTHTQATPLEGLQNSVISIEPAITTYCIKIQWHTVQKTVRRRQFPMTAAYAVLTTTLKGRLCHTSSLISHHHPLVRSVSSVYTLCFQGAVEG